MTATRGSGRGTSGIDTRPAPSRLRADWPVDVPELRTDTERDVDEAPESERESRPETERREVEERDEARDDARELLREELESGPPTPEPPPPTPPVPVPLPGTATPVGVEPMSPPAATTGARPQVSQYSSPPPMSSYEPSHEGR
ncbi:hypothetical protein J3A78_002700 [Streptomyces sp. PvR006]|nr:hypothetical protein [Streptomyces sp. PvR006]